MNFLRLTTTLALAGVIAAMSTSVYAKDRTKGRGALRARRGA